MVRLVGSASKALKRSRHSAENRAFFVLAVRNALTHLLTHRPRLSKNPQKKADYERYKLLIIPWSLVRIQAGPVSHRRQTHSLYDARAGRGEWSKPTIVLVNLDGRRANPGKGLRRRGIEFLESYGRVAVPKRASWTRSPLSN